MSKFVDNDRIESTQVCLLVILHCFMRVTPHSSEFIFISRSVFIVETWIFNLLTTVMSSV